MDEFFIQERLNERMRQLDQTAVERLEDQLLKAHEQNGNPSNDLKDELIELLRGKHYQFVKFIVTNNAGFLWA